MVLPQTEVTRVGVSLRSAALDGGAAFAADERTNFSFGAIALQLMGNGSSYSVSPAYVNAFIESLVLHESGHDFGLRHNFIGSEAYTAKELQDAAFTARYGVASSVMEYAPINLWPKGTPQGSYFQTVLGPYDYYAIHWGYAPVAGARTPVQELLTLRRWAGQWGSANDKYSSDEDVAWISGARVAFGQVDSRFPQSGLSYDDLRYAFGAIMNGYGRCGSIVSRYLGGEYVLRALCGATGTWLPPGPVLSSTQKRAFAVLKRNVFAADAWNLTPDLLRRMVTQYLFDDWLGNLPPRHDIAMEQYVARYQLAVLARLYAPVTLARLDDMDLKYRPGTTMDLADLFSWMQKAIYSDAASGNPIPFVRRNLQRNYTALLSKLANAPMRGTPTDAQALARYQLESLRDTIGSALRRGGSDMLTRAHLEAMQADVERTLNAHYVITMEGS